MRLLVLLLLAACGGAPPHATSVDALRANVAVEQLEQGRALLLEKCNRCHAAPHPRRFPAPEWPAKVGDMVERAQVDPAQRKTIELYLTTLAER